MPVSKRFKREARREVLRLQRERVREQRSGRATEKEYDRLGSAGDDIGDSREGIINASRKLGYASTSLQGIQGNQTAKKYSRELRGFQQTLVKMDKQLDNMNVTLRGMAKGR